MSESSRRWIVDLECGHAVAVVAIDEGDAGNQPDGAGGRHIRVCELCAGVDRQWWGTRSVRLERYPGEPAVGTVYDFSPATAGGRHEWDWND